MKDVVEDCVDAYFLRKFGVVFEMTKAGLARVVEVWGYKAEVPWHLLLLTFSVFAMIPI